MTVVVTDPLCTAIPSRVSTNADASPNSLDPGGDRWTYACSVQAQPGQTLIDNVATVRAADQFDRTVTSTDNAVTTLTSPPPPPQPPAPAPAPTTGSGADTVPPAPSPAPAPSRATPVVTGRAILHGPSRCVPRSFKAFVTGRRIARVRFYVDGRLVLTLTRPNGPNSSYERVIDTARFGGGKHRVVAKVKFLSSAQTREATRTFTFTRCASARRAVRFTG